MATRTMRDAARRYYRSRSDVQANWTGFAPRVGRFYDAIPQNRSSSSPLIFLVLRAFWTDWIGRTGCEGGESPSTFYDRVALGVDNPSE